jgi:hypothetical protein
MDLLRGPGLLAAEMSCFCRRFGDLFLKILPLARVFTDGSQSRRRFPNAADEPRVGKDEFETARSSIGAVGARPYCGAKTSPFSKGATPSSLIKVSTTSKLASPESSLGVGTMRISLRCCIAVATCTSGRWFLLAQRASTLYPRFAMIKPASEAAFPRSPLMGTGTCRLSMFLLDSYIFKSSCACISPFHYFHLTRPAVTLCILNRS